MDVRKTSRGERHPAHWTPVTRGAIRRVKTEDVLLAESRAWASVLPAYACFTHLSAARLWGLWLPPLPERTPVVVQLPPGTTKPERPGLRSIRSEAIDSPCVRRGVRFAGVTDVLLSLCRDLEDLDALVALDSALHLGLVDRSHLVDQARQRRRGAPRLSRILRHADGRSESAWETLMREFHRTVGAAVTPQHEVRDADGVFIARGDLWLDGTRVLHEYDGAHHLDVTRQRDDLRRARRLMAAGWARRGYSAQDLTHRAVGVLRDVDQSLGRDHDPSRVRGWHDLLRGSAFTRPGQLSLARRLGV